MSLLSSKVYKNNFVFQNVSFQVNKFTLNKCKKIKIKRGVSFRDIKK